MQLLNHYHLPLNVLQLKYRKRMILWILIIVLLLVMLLYHFYNFLLFLISSSKQFRLQVTESNPQLSSNDNNEGTSKSEPIPIYVRPSELCFDDVADGGEILSEFFMPSSTSNFQPAKSSLTNDTTLTTPVFTIFLIFN